MKVSIITATYNSACTIENCINSVISQSYPHIEYLIIDGGSKDNTIETVKALTKDNSKVKFISEPDKGIYDALNKGIALATGDVIGFVHSDDFLADISVVDTIVNTMESSHCDGVYGNLHYVAIENTSKIVRNWIGKPFNPSMLKQGWMPAHPTLYLKKSVYNTFGSFNLNYSIAADYDFILRIFKQPKLRFVFLPKTIVKMRIGGASNRSLSNIIQKSREDYRAVRQNKVGGWWTIVLKNTSKFKQFIPTR